MILAWISSTLCDKKSEFWMYFHLQKRCHPQGVTDFNPFCEKHFITFNNSEQDKVIVVGICQKRCQRQNLQKKEKCLTVIKFTPILNSWNIDKDTLTSNGYPIADCVFFAVEIIHSIIIMAPQSPLQKWKIKKGLLQ